MNLDEWDAINDGPYNFPLQPGLILKKRRESGMDDLAGTYFVQDRSNQEELKRLIVQERMVTDAMGGVLPEQQDPTLFQQVLDIGCGPGGWLIEMAQVHPQIKKLYGIDISPTMIQYAQKRAEEQQLPKERVEFLVMDALRMLEFPNSFFDLVNFRFSVSFMRKWDWPKMFSEMHRVLKPQGIVRIVEVETNVESSSTAFSNIMALMRRGFERAGYLFEETPTGLTDHLPELLLRHDFQNIRTCKTPVVFRAGTETGKAFFEDFTRIFHTIRPFFQRYGCLPQDYDALCQQATQDMQQPDFVAEGTYHTIWATNPAQTRVGQVQREMPS
jgi:ubiquinone/menaquinone biosynthesis C-methylase UbiE